MANYINQPRQTLEKRLAELIEEFDAVYQQLGSTLDSGITVRLKNRASELEREILEIQEKLRNWGDGDWRQEKETCPFKSLDFFDEADAHLFFGRARLTAELLNHLSKHNFLAVVGGSGSGKSSVIHAGVIPKLRAGQFGDESISSPEGSSHWPIHILTPNVHPLESLAISLTQDTQAIDETETLRKTMLNNARGLYVCIQKKMYSRRRSSRFLLVIDQFEELFTLCKDEVERQAFVDNLLTAVDPKTAGSTTLILVIRSDFIHRCEPYPKLYQLIRRHEILVTRMTTDELREAIEQPAIQNGFEFAPGLVDHILSDLSNISAPLPLLSHALYETWQRRRGNTLAFQAYAESGEVEGAIAKTADRVYEHDLDTDQQIISWHIFSRLIELGESAFETRRRATLEELIVNPEQADAVQKVLDILVRYRLITTSDTSIELTHEAIIANWPRLRQWLEKNKEGLIIYNRLSELAADWNANDRHKDFLVVGRRLEPFEQWRPPDEMSLNTIEKAFVEASRQKNKQLEEKDRHLAQKKLQERRIKWFGASVFICALVALTVLASFRRPPFTPSWRWTNGPVGGDTWLTAVNPTTPQEIYIGYGRKGVYKSYDGGHSWLPANTGLASQLVGNLTLDANTDTLFAVTEGTEGVNLYRSNDGGSNWTSILEGLPPDVIIRDISLHDGTPSELYIATWQYGIWSTPIDEINWQQKTWLGLESPSIHQVKITDDSPPIIYASSSYHGLFRSLDSGLSWEQIAFPDGDVTALGIAPWNSNIIYAYDALTGPYISQDGGLSWLAIADQITKIPRSRPYFYTEGQSNAIYVGTYDGQIFRSNENGDDWQRVWNSVPIATIRDVTILPTTNDILLSTSNGVYLSNDAGNSWQLTGPDVLPVSALTSQSDGSGSEIMVATNSGIHRHLLDGAWETLNGGLSELTISDLVTSPDSSLSETYAVSDRGKLYSLLTGGDRWQPVPLPPDVQVKLIAPGVNPLAPTLIVTDDNKVYQTSDRVNWHYLWQAPGTITAILSSPQSPDTFYLATSGNGIYHSMDAGVNWLPANNSLTDPSVNDLFISSNSGNLLYAATNDGVFVSQNGGQSWNHSTTGLTTRSVTSVAAHPRFDAMVYAGTPGGIFISYDFGQSWRTFDKGLQDRNIFSVSVDSDYVHVGTSRGVYYMKHPVLPTLLWSN